MSYLESLFWVDTIKFFKCSIWLSMRRVMVFWILPKRVFCVGWVVACIACWQARAVQYTSCMCVDLVVRDCVLGVSNNNVLWLLGGSVMHLTVRWICIVTLKLNICTGTYTNIINWPINNINQHDNRSAYKWWYITIIINSPKAYIHKASVLAVSGASFAHILWSIGLG